MINKNQKKEDIYFTTFELPLERSWIFWIHNSCFGTDYKKSRKPIHEMPINTIRFFWRYFNNIPLISKFSLQKKINYEGLSFFINGIKPDWEDPMNQNGCTITFKSMFRSEQINEIWMHTLLTIIGETIPYSNEVIGARVIYRSNYRIEIWMFTNNESKIKDIELFFKETIFIGNLKPKKLIIFSSSHQK